jgi:integrase
MASIQERQTKNGTVYQVKWRSSLKGGRYSYKSFGGKTAAKEFCAWAELEEGKLRKDPRLVGAVDRQTVDLSIGDAMDEWLDICEKEGLSGREPLTDYSVENYKYRAKFVKAYNWKTTIGNLTPPDIVEFRSYLLRSDISRDLARKVLRSLQSMLKEMAVRGRIQANVAIGVGIRDDSRYDEPVVIPTRAEVRALLMAADKLSQSSNEQIARAWRKYRPMLYLAVDSGMRPQEYLAVSKSALTDHGIFVERAIEGDGSKISVTKTPTGRRFIDLSPKAIAILQEHAASLKGKNPHNLLFPRDDGGWQERRNWQHRGFDVACQEANLMVARTQGTGKAMVPKFRPYDLRHFFASVHIARKTNLKKLQELMGHKDIETTLNNYGHLIKDMEQPAIGALSDVLDA